MLTAGQFKGHWLAALSPYPEVLGLAGVAVLHAHGELQLVPQLYSVRSDHC